jgi:hypothetical protein
MGFCPAAVALQQDTTHKYTLKLTKTPWPESPSELYRPTDRRLLAKLVPTFADTQIHVSHQITHHAETKHGTQKYTIKDTLHTMNTIQVLTYLLTYSVALVRMRTIPTERLTVQVQLINITIRQTPDIQHYTLKR